MKKMILSLLFLTSGAQLFSSSSSSKFDYWSVSNKDAIVEDIAKLRKKVSGNDIILLYSPVLESAKNWASMGNEQGISMAKRAIELLSNLNLQPDPKLTGKDKSQAVSLHNKWKIFTNELLSGDTMDF